MNNQNPERKPSDGSNPCAKDPRGGPSDLVIVRPLEDHTTTRSGRAALDFIQGWERATGKQIVFVASSSGEPLPFTGVVSPSDPNTIFLDVAGDRMFLRYQMTKV